MKKKIWYIVIVFFFCLGCESIVKADDVENADDLITDVRPPKPFAGQQIQEKNPPTTKPHKKIILVSPDNQPEEVVIEIDEDEQIKQILIEKLNKAYKENRENIKIFLCRIIFYAFTIILILILLVKILDAYLPYPFGFLIVMIVLAILAIISINVYL